MLKIAWNERLNISDQFCPTEMVSLFPNAAFDQSTCSILSSSIYVEETIGSF